ncbi:MAG TPA: serine/threonine-protein kinase [Thermoanaerobaculia bacterium]
MSEPSGGSWLSDGAVDRLARAAAGPASPDEPPDLSATRYELLEPVGRGGMGAVYRARDRELGREVAIKVIGSAHPDAVRRMLREARVIARLEHPGIVPVHDVGSLPDGRVFYAMRLVRGTRLDEEMRSGRPLPELLRIFERVCDAVAFAHAHGVIHRDLKPENVMVGPFGEVLVMDWGVAKVLAEVPAEEEEPPAPDGSASDAPPDATDHGTVLGTPGFMAPEQARGEVARIDERADVHALGAILRELMRSAEAGEAGKHAIRSARSIRPLAAVRDRALAASPSDRYPSARELAADVGRHLDGLPVSAHRESAVERLVRFGRRYRVAILLVLAYVVMRAILMLWTGV